MRVIALRMVSLRCQCDRPGGDGAVSRPPSGMATGLAGLPALDYHWKMKNVQSTSDAAQALRIQLSQRLVDLFNRSQAMGLRSAMATSVMPAASEPAALPSAVELNARSIRVLMSDLQRHGIGTDANLSLAALMQDGPARLDPATTRALEIKLDQLTQALEDSPAPASEWPSMRGVLADDLLGELLAVSPSSLRRYATGERVTPDAIATQLHWLAMLVSDLAGAYNHLGMRRWFDRPRAQLKGKSPRDALGSDWHPDDAIAMQVRALAAVLSGAQPLSV
jgi:hypothetical protein